jgi:hypothetical protein
VLGVDPTMMHRVVCLAADDRVDDERLQPRVPGAARLRGVGVDLGRGEGDLTAVEEHRLSDLDLVTACRESHRLPLDDVDDGPHEVQRLPEADRPGQLTRRRAEDVGGDMGLVLAPGEPLDEGPDAGLGDEPHPRALLRRQRPVPLVVGLHLLHRSRAEVPRGALDPASGRR